MKGDPRSEAGMTLWWGRAKRLFQDHILRFGIAAFDHVHAAAQACACHGVAEFTDMSGLEFADKRSERAKYFICILKTF